MEKVAKKISFFIILFNFASMGQTTIKIKSGNSFEFDKKTYYKIANDCLKNIYKKQEKFYANKNNVLNKENTISQKYKINELSFISLPIFKLNRNAKNLVKLKIFHFILNLKTH